MSFLKLFYKDIISKIIILDNKSFNSFDKDIYENLKKFYDNNNEHNERLFIQKEILTCKNKGNLSWKKLTNIYFLDTGIKIRKMKLIIL